MDGYPSTIEPDWFVPGLQTRFPQKPKQTVPYCSSHPSLTLVLGGFLRLRSGWVGVLRFGGCGVLLHHAIDVVERPLPVLYFALVLSLVAVRHIG